MTSTTTQNDYAACIDACQACITACGTCFDQMVGQKSDSDCPRCCVDCIAICQLAVQAMSSGSPFADKICALCAEICTWCAEECESMGHDHCKACAEACRRCADTCSSMAA